MLLLQFVHNFLHQAQLLEEDLLIIMRCIFTQLVLNKTFVDKAIKNNFRLLVEQYPGDYFVN
jgi:hypothetical protein